MRSVSEWIEFFRNAPEDAKKEIKELSRKEYYELLCQDGSEKIPYAETQLHCHTDLGSPKDSVLRVDDYVRVNKTLHTDTASVTDHGTMYGIPFVYDAFQSNKMKLIVGLEAYLCDDVEDHNMKTHTRLHLILYAKDNLGYQGLSDLVTRSNYRILETKGGSFPCVSKQMLEELCGPGKIYHGHIIATSACVGGVLAGIGYANETNQKNLEVINGKIQKLTRLLDSYQTLNTELQTSTSVFQEHSKASSQEEVNRISSILKSMKKHPEDYSDEERAKANKESDRITQLRSQLPSEKKMVRGKQKQVNGIIDMIQKEVGKIFDDSSEMIHDTTAFLQEQKTASASIASRIVPEDQYLSFIKKEMLYYRDLFGPECWYTELQFHGIEKEAKFMPLLARVSIENKIPLVAANDAHMATKDMLMARKAINALRFNQWDDPRDGDSELYLKTDGELFKALCNIVPKQVAGSAILNRKYIADACNVTFEKVPHYPKFQP